MLGKGSCEAGSDSWADRQRTGGQRSALVATREASEDMGQGSEMKPKDRQEAESDAWGVGIRGVSPCVDLNCANMFPTQKN